MNLAKNEEWRIMWGAKVKQPCDMPDDMLKDFVTKTSDLLSKVETTELQEKGPDIVKAVKLEADTKYGGNWHVIIGRNFGCDATHRAGRFVFFYVSDVATMIYQT